MPTNQKRTISAKAILADVRAGMDKEGIKLKYQLSDKSYERVLLKLADAGFLKPETEAEKDQPVSEFRSSEPVEPLPMIWNCPACGTSQPQEYEECPQCGIVASKYTAPREIDHPVLLRPSESEVDSDKSVGNKIVVIAVSIVVFIAVGAAFLKFTSDDEPQPTPTMTEYTPEEEQTVTSQYFEDEALRVSELSEEGSTDFGNESTQASGNSYATNRVSKTNNQTARASGSKANSGKRKYRTGSVQTFTTSNFKQQVVKASETFPILVEFYTKSCPACKVMEPVLANLAKDMRDKAIIGKVGPRERELFSTFNITGVPTMFILRDGEIQETFVGPRPKEMLAKALSSYAPKTARVQ